MKPPDLFTFTDFILGYNILMKLQADIYMEGIGRGGLFIGALKLLS